MIFYVSLFFLHRVLKFIDLYLSRQAGKFVSFSLSVLKFVSERGVVLGDGGGDGGGYLPGEDAAADRDGGVGLTGVEGGVRVDGEDGRGGRGGAEAAADRAGGGVLVGGGGGGEVTGDDGVVLGDGGCRLGEDVRGVVPEDSGVGREDSGQDSVSLETVEDSFSGGDERSSR